MNPVEQLAGTIVRVTAPSAPILQPNEVGEITRVADGGAPAGWEVTVKFPKSDPLPIGRARWSPTFIDQVTALGSQLVGRKVLVHFTPGRQPVVAYTVGD